MALLRAAYDVRWDDSAISTRLTAGGPEVPSKMKTSIKPQITATMIQQLQVGFPVWIGADSLYGESKTSFVNVMTSSLRPHHQQSAATMHNGYPKTKRDFKNRSGLTHLQQWHHRSALHGGRLRRFLNNWLLTTNPDT